MDHRNVIATRLLPLILMVIFVLGCTSTRGNLGVDWAPQKAVHHPEVGVAPKHNPPPREPDHRNQTAHVYRCYPDSEVYYDTGRRIYFYIESGAWESDALLPYQLRQSLGHYEAVKLFSDTPYGYHEATFKKTYRVLPRKVKPDANRVKP